MTPTKETYRVVGDVGNAKIGEILILDEIVQHPENDILDFVIQGTNKRLITTRRELKKMIKKPLIIEI